MDAPPPPPSPEFARWFYPGDRGVIHPDGTFSILGRADNLVNSGGVKVQLEALDARLSTVPGLVDWAYFTDVDAFGIERLILAAVALPEHQSTLVTAVNERTPDVPVNRLYLVDEIPRNAMGKVLRHELRQRFATLASQQ
jgi:acyl-coenzyme A synthetase/AMP-(fatty) acid ligase